jgi:hypothetical protein
MKLATSSLLIIGMAPQNVKPMIAATISEQKWIDRAEMLKPNDPVTVLGKIEKINSISLHLCETEIVTKSQPS